MIFNVETSCIASQSTALNIRVARYDQCGIVQVDAVRSRCAGSSQVQISGRQSCISKIDACRIVFSRLGDNLEAFSGTECNAGVRARVGCAREVNAYSGLSTVRFHNGLAVVNRNFCIVGIVMVAVADARRRTSTGCLDGKSRALHREVHHLIPSRMIKVKPESNSVFRRVRRFNLQVVDESQSRLGIGRVHHHAVRTETGA